MKLKSFVQVIVVALVTSFSLSAFSTEDASMHQVYLAAEAGKFSEAQSMMDKVLHDHPSSAKAHFVEAELLAKQGLYKNAQDELTTAERLQPNLSFVKPQTLEKLKAQISTAHPVSQVASNHNFQPASSGATPWGMIFLMVGLIAFIYLAAKWMTKRATDAAPVSNYPSTANLNSAQYGPSVSTMGQASGGLGSTMMSGLATGAAVGAGMVAGEAIMHHFTDGDRGSNEFINTAQAIDRPENQNDMGGTDFGIADSSSWDDASGSDDWT